MRQERLLTTRQGIPGRPWFRHQIYAPGINTGYAAQFLPGIRDALDAGDAATVTTYRDLLLDSLRRATATASTRRRPERRLVGGEAAVRHPVDRCRRGDRATQRPGVGGRLPGTLSP